MTDIFAIETSARTAGFAVRAEIGFRFYASDHAFADLERRNYARLEDIHADVRRLTARPKVPNAFRHRGKHRSRPARG